MLPKFVVHLLSGGLDSTVLLYDLLQQQCQVHCILIDYGQKHCRKELGVASMICERLKVPRSRIDIPPLLGSRLTDGRCSFVVPNRNMVMLSLAVSIAADQEADSVTYACNKDDHEVFADCRPDFVAAMNVAVRAAGVRVEVCAPYIEMTKRQIVDKGHKLHVPLNQTWSCYEAGPLPCGTCPACIKRHEAMIP